ncbi:MAG: alpha/beta hydrolase [Chitinophagia bacterium]|nr:alpha/beta hydrolase [Chitinophagia bacterium]
MKPFLLALLSILWMSQGYCQNKYLFYLHGQIVEELGADATDPVRGKYEYKKILDTFSSKKFTVISEVRPAGTDVKEYAKKVAQQIDSLIKSGVGAEKITIVGASKGAQIAMWVCSIAKNSKLNFVLMSGCNERNVGNPDLQLYGNVLSIYEKTDNIGRSCANLQQKSSHITRYKEIELNTGLHHGYFFKPISEWLQPTLSWANGK